MSDWYAVAFDQPVQGMDAGWVNAAEVVPKFVFTPGTTTGGTSGVPKSVTDRMYEKIMTSVRAFRDKYENNPDVTVSGFSVGCLNRPSAVDRFLELGRSCT